MPPSVNAVEIVLAHRKSKPQLAVGREGHHRLAGFNDLTRLGDADADGAVGRRGQPGLVELCLEPGDRRFGQRHPRIGQGALLGSGSGAGFLGLGALQIEVGLGFGQRSRALVELLAAGEILARQRGGAVVLLLSEDQIGFGGAHGLRCDCHLFCSHAGVDAVPLGPSAPRRGNGFAQGSGELRIVDHRNKLALADMLTGRHRDRGEPARRLWRDADLRLADHP